MKRQLTSKINNIKSALFKSNKNKEIKDFLTSLDQF
jgi:hypothetical protein